MKKLFRIFAIPLIGVLAISLSACTKKTEGEKVSLDPTSLEFSWAAGEKTVTVKGTDWTADVDATWLSIDPKTGTDGTITVTVTANTGEDRFATLTVTNDLGSESLRIDQLTAGKITFDPESLEFNCAAGEKTVAVTGTDWTASVDATWLTVDPKTGTDGTITVTVTANDTGEDRSADITLTNAFGSKDLKVTQTAPAEITVNPEAIELIFVGETKTVAVETSIAWTVAVTSDNSSWLTVTKAGDNEFTATAVANDGDARTATVTIDNGETTKEMTVTQEQNYGELLIAGSGKFLGESWGPGTGDFELELLTFEKLEGGGVSEAGYAVYLNPITQTPSYDEWCISMTEGTYEMSSSTDAMTLYPNYQWITTVDENGKGTSTKYVKSGTLTVEGTYAHYTLILDFVLSDDSEFKGIYRGPILIRNPKQLSDFDEDLDITLTQGALNFVSVYQNTIDIWRPQFLSSGLYVKDGYLEGDGYVFTSEIYSPTTGGKSFPDGEYTIVPRGTPTSVFTAYTGFEYNGVRYCTWIMELKDGVVSKSAPIVSGTITASNSGGTFVLDAKDDIGNSMKATFTSSTTGLTSAAVPVNESGMWRPGDKVPADIPNNRPGISKPEGKTR